MYILIRGQSLRTIGIAMYLHTSTVVLQDQKDWLKIEEVYKVSIDEDKQM